MPTGGRLQILGRSAPPTTVATPLPAEAEPTEAVSLPPEAEPRVDVKSDWDEEAESVDSHWREDKAALLPTLKSEVSTTDPCPDIPASFLDVVRIPKLARQLKKNARTNEEAAADRDEPEVADEALQSSVYEPTEVLRRQVAASRSRWPAFAPLVAAADWALGFQGSKRRTFVADGSSNNWRLPRRFFGSFIPILDFIHALSYIFAAAMAGPPFATGWHCYQEWIAWVWQGKGSLVIAALQRQQAELGLPEKGAAETNPRQVVCATLTYLENQKDKMKYAEYRQQGLPITSSLMESAVKQINQRVKGTEKFWSEEGSEAVLQRRADQLSDGDILADFWQRRQAAATGQRCYHCIA